MTFIESPPVPRWYRTRKWLCVVSFAVGLGLILSYLVVWPFGGVKHPLMTGVILVIASQGCIGCYQHYAELTERWRKARATRSFFYHGLFGA